VAELATELGLEVLTPARPAEPEFLARLAELRPDCCPVVAYGALITRAALDIPVRGWVNLHFSLLPAWRGAAPVQHSLWRGEEITGASVFKLEEQLDTGPVYGTATERIRARDTAGELLDRLAESGAGLLLATLDLIESGGAVAVPQPAEGVSFAPKLSVADARVDWSEPASAVDRRIRACTPGPGGWTTFRGERLKLGPVVPAEKAGRLGPGALRVSGGQVLAGTATTPVLLGEVVPPGRRAMPAADWARGARPEENEQLGGPLDSGQPSGLRTERDDQRRDDQRNEDL
jgi:methionyl-tRNA formyltransferase